MTEQRQNDYPLRLQKFLARAGVASRRGSENLMTAGRVTVNGRVVTELGTKVDPRCDVVAVDGAVVEPGGVAVTLMLNKPAGVVTTMSDPQGRPTVASLVPTGNYPGLFPIGRLDFDTTGLLLFSTDGDLGHALLHPRHHVTKRYVALVEGRPTASQLARLRAGIELDDGPTLPAEVELLTGAAAKEAFEVLDVPPSVPKGSSRQYAAIRRDRAQVRSLVRIGICEGRKRQVRRMFDAVGHRVVALHRDSFGPLALEGLAPGAWRELDGGQIAQLRRVAGLTC